MMPHYVEPRAFERWLAANGYMWNYEERPDTAGALFSTEARMLQYIVPNIPRGDEQTNAFARAVYRQCWFENSADAQQMDDIPSNVKSFTVNGFSASIDSDRRNSILPSGIAPEARSILALAGLIYKGVIVC